MNNFTLHIDNDFTLDRLLSHEALAGERTDIRKAFASMLNPRGGPGEPGYAAMVLETAFILLDEMGLGADPVKCIILKEQFDRGWLDAAAIDREHGKPVRELLEGIRRLEELDTKKYSSNAENFIGLLLTLPGDIRILLIRLGMRLFDMRHLAEYPRPKQELIAGETKALFIPIAHRLGLYRIKNELEDREMHFSDPENYHLIQEKLRDTEEVRDHYAALFIRPISERLAKEGFDCEILSRVKSIPSIRRKMAAQKVEFEKVYDLFAIRVILNHTIENEAADCWKIYSLVTDTYTPNPRRLRDWISFPKPTGYESLHTTVIGPEGRWVEVQIRTRRMDEIAEKGYAAHWKYKQGVKAEAREEFYAGIRSMLEKPLRSSPGEAPSREKRVLYTDEIFIFTPQGDLKRMKAGYSVLDFAYEIHSEVGSTCTGAIVNGKMVPLRHILSNGDKVKILTSKNQKPNPGWLEIAKSPRNLARIKHALKMETYREADYGKEIIRNKVIQLGHEFTDSIINRLADWFGCDNIMELYQRFGEGKADPLKIKKALEEKAAEPAPAATKEEVSFPARVSDMMAGREDFVVIDPSIKSLHYQFARCCNPVPGQPIFAFVSVTQGIRIHQTTCRNARQLITRYPYRVMEARWRAIPQEKDDKRGKKEV
ncbi:MAG TPA: TGS domain-containing protein [Bacteroidales bacterium]|nr:TGS domain-containing protein [Bacteroidales bacterium]HPS63449.1 TGS domain-containing protein [Bacteroidales bacterium]